MASYSVNNRAVARARRLIDAHQYVLQSNWGEVQPSANDKNASWSRTRGMNTPNGISDSPTVPTTRPRRNAFVYGDLRRVHRMGLIACQYRAAEWRHKDVELAAHELLQHLDNTRG